MESVQHRVSRRDFLAGAAAGAASLAWSRSGRAAAPRFPQKPNILWIMSDEHNATVAGCYGNRTVQTPNLDRLAAEGVTFDTHYCNSPLCVPSRLSLTAGKYTSRVDVWGLTNWLPSAEIPSLARCISSAGYESFLCGKQHYDYSRRYGFTDAGGNFNQWYKTGRGRRLSPDHLTEKRLSPRFGDFHPGDHGSTVEHDRLVADGAVDFLGRRGAGGKPFFLFTGFLAPHFPLIVPEQNYDRYRGKVPMPVIPPGFLDNLSLNYKVQRAGFEELAVPPETVQRGRELYYGLTDWVDGEIGRVLAALRANPAIAENTIVLYSSDHGENMGDRGFWWKNCMFDSATRVPLIVHWPNRWAAGQRRAGASSHVDLVKTVIEMAGGETPEDWNGSSMLDWLDDGQAGWKNYAAVEYYGLNTASGYVMARDGDWKYTYHSVIDRDHPSQQELYNVAQDPNEFTNLAARPESAARMAAMRTRLFRELGGDPDETEQRARYQLARGYDRTDPKPPLTGAMLEIEQLSHPRRARRSSGNGAETES